MTMNIDLFRSRKARSLFTAFALSAVAITAPTSAASAASRQHAPSITSFFGLFAATAASHRRALRVTKPRAVARPAHKPRTAQRAESDFDCAVHVAFGEARSQTMVEQAVIINGLMVSARRAGHSICAEAHGGRYAPRTGSNPSIIKAAENVFSHGASMVPRKFAAATEFRAPYFHKSPGRHFRLVGQISRGGNVFYEPV